MHVPIENIVPVSKAKEQLEDMVGKLKGDDMFVLTHAEQPAAVLISVDHLKRLIGSKDQPDVDTNKAVSPASTTTKPEPYSPLSPRPISPAPTSPSLPPLPKIGEAPKPPTFTTPTSSDPLVTQKEVEKVLNETSSPSSILPPLEKPVAPPPIPPLPSVKPPEVPAFPSINSAPTPKPPMPVMPPPASPFANISSGDVTPSAPIAVSVGATTKSSDSDIDEEIL